MEPTSFIAASAEEAVAQIRAKFGPEAVVLNVRRLPPNGMARLWQKPMIEVLACKPEAPAPEAAPFSEALAEFRQELAEIKQQVATHPPGLPAAPCAAGMSLNGGNWRIGAVLRKSGLLPLTRAVLDRLHAQFRGSASFLGEEIYRTQEVLSAFWRKPSHRDRIPPCFYRPGRVRQDHLPVQMADPGPDGRTSGPGVRLDGVTANMAESLSVYCEFWRPQ